MAKKEGGGKRLERPSRGAKYEEFHGNIDSTGLPAVSVYVASIASPHHEVILDEATISKCFITDEKPEHLVVGDKAYDR
jgi:hypothetical protein